MSAIAVSIAVFACTFAGALAGLLIHARLPASHLEGDSKDVVKLVMGLMATLSALVLGLLISSAHHSYELQQQEVQIIGISIFQLDRALERLGPDAKDARELVRHIVTAELARASATDGMLTAIETPIETQRAAAALFDRIAAHSPGNDMQRIAQQRALHLLNTLGETRLLLTEQSRGAISWPFLVVLTFWLTILFAGFGLFARTNTTVIVSLGLGALSVAGAVFLILEMNRPYTGIMQISIEPIRSALTQMSR